jgi:hypothetical protein
LQVLSGAQMPPAPVQSLALAEQVVVSHSPLDWSQCPLRHSASAEQVRQSGWGGWQLHEPSVLQTPPASVQVVSAEQVVVWHSPFTHEPLRQSALVVHEPQVSLMLQLQVPSLAQAPPAVVHSAALAEQVVVLHWPVVWSQWPLVQSVSAEQ